MNTLCIILLVGLTGNVRSVAVKGTCGTDADCDENLYCENTVCIKKIDQACTAADDDCVHGATCGGVAGSTTCMCDATTMVPKADKSMCLKKIDQACTAADDDCVHGATCGGDAGSTTCMCNATTMVPKADKSMCQVKAGMTCTADPADQCIMGATCVSSMCKCEDGHTASADKTMCLMNIGGMCKESTDCVQGSPKVNCTNEKCACAPMYAPNDMMNMCKLKLNESCEMVDQCGVNTVCSTRCTCKANYVTEDNRCGMMVGGSCMTNPDCVMNAECKSDNKCACKGTYTSDGDFCKSGSAAVVASLFLMVAAFVTSRLM